MKYLIKKDQPLKMLDAREFGLSARTVIGQTENTKAYIIMDRKSRIIMRDGLRIMRIVEQIKKKYPSIPIGIATNASICSKTTAYLMQNRVEIATLDKG